MNVLDIADARLLAEVKARKWIEEFEAEYNKPIMDMVITQAWQGVPEEVKAELAKRAPKETRYMNQKYGGV